MIALGIKDEQNRLTKTMKEQSETDKNAISQIHQKTKFELLIYKEKTRTQQR